MTATSRERGWPIFWDGSVWRYCDTLEIAEGKRACRQCGRSPIDGKDACLILYHEDKQISSACCGHGIKGVNILLTKEK